MLLRATSHALCGPSVVHGSSHQQSLAPSVHRHAAQRRLSSLPHRVQQSQTVTRDVRAHAAEQVKSAWWEKSTENMRDVNGIQEMVDALADAGDRLVIVDFYAPWCGACRALYPKLCRLMDEYPDVVFLKVNFEENRPMCKTLGVKVLPYFHVYHGALGRVASFSCTVSKLARMKEALAEYSTPQCSLEPNPGLPEFPDIIPHPSEVTRVGGSVVPAAEALMSMEPAGVA